MKFNCFDNRLLRNFYLNKGFYDVKINSICKISNEDEFELHLVDANDKFFFNNLNLNS